MTDSETITLSGDQELLLRSAAQLMRDVLGFSEERVNEEIDAARRRVRNREVRLLDGRRAEMARQRGYLSPGDYDAMKR